MAAMTVAAVVTPALAGPAHAASTRPLPLPPLRIPRLDLGVEQQSDEKVRWLQDAKIGMFIHWGPYSGPAKGEWYMENAAITPENYKKYVTDATSEQFTGSAYDPAAWAQLAKDMGAKYTVLTARHHDGFALWPSTHPNAWHSGQAPLQKDFVGQYVTAVRDAGLKVGLYFSPLSWRYPGYYDVRGTNCLPNAWGYTTDPAHKENARIMKNEVYQQVKELVTQYGKIDDIWWDGGWLGQQGSDADAGFFWEPGKFREPSNEWPVDAAYSDTDPATGKPLGLTGLVRKHQPDAVTTLRAGWIGDFVSEEGPSVPSGAIRAGKVSEKCFTIGGAWGYKAGSGVMSFGNAMNILVNAWVRNMTCLVNVGPDRTGAVPSAQQSLVRQIGSFLTTCGEAVYGTRGGPWNPVDGKYGFTYKDRTFYVHLLPGHSGTSFTTPQIGDATVTRVFDVASGTDLPFSVNDSGEVTITGINRTRIPEDSVVGVTLDRTVQPTDIAAGRTATASSEESSKGNTAAKAVDGSTATRWCANNGNTGQWLKVDLGAVKPITGARIAWELDATNYRYRIEGSTDNTTWTTLADRTDTTSTSQVQVAMFSASARYVRVTVTGLPSGVWASLRNVEVYDRPFAADLGTFRVVNRKSGKVLDVNGASSADGATLIQWPSTGGTNQQWKLLPNTDGSYRLSNVRSGKVLNSPSSSAQGAGLDQSSDTDSDNQWWKLVPATSGYYRLVNVGNGWCADVKDASTADGAAIIQWPNTGGTNQEWQVIAL
ncbi:alpha-L-fucosidase [Streptomyces caniscabiei]|uniref:alpha-L-fucosidase n=1 Tax=Streptomyces caniscabiei TaxID=2746961 RepID=UPI0029ADBFDB|nr:alpha-L-fucosidase [Streptomyces caniscabiei]MDX2600796.1 alpha-L-fucosidase [Streptomyces caniscabiei]MDX2736623.1 alpha-L-fucosidase [Streptomyces caniscabiei]